MTRASVVVTTRNSADTLDACLSAIRAQTHAELELVVVDNGSSDATKTIAERHADLTLDVGPERSAQRNAGGRAATGAVLFFVDSDMVLEPGVVAQAVAEVEAGADQVVIPERSFGAGFWAQVKAFERSLYVGDDTVEAARAFARPAWEAVGGYDEAIVAGPEDWDIDQRVRALGGRRTRTAAFIDHDEGRLGLGETMRTKYYYGKSSAGYFARHGAVAAKQASPVRPAFLRRRSELAAQPVLAGAMIAMKVAELSAGAAGLVGVELCRGRRGGTGVGDPVREGHGSVAPVASPSMLTQLKQLQVAFRDWPKAAAAGLAWKRLPLPARSLVLHTRGGSDVAAPLRRDAGSLYTAFQVFAFSHYDHLGELDEGAFVVDVGANLGAFVLWAAERSPGLRGLAFEPDPLAYDFLERNLERNDITGVAPRRAAVGARDGNAVLHRSGDGDGVSTLFPGRRGHDALLTETLEVSVSAFDAIVSDLGEQRIDVLKLDCEGAEHAIVNDSDDRSWDHIQRVILEYHPVDGSTAAHLEATLVRRGFRLLAREESELEVGVLWLAR